MFFSRSYNKYTRELANHRYSPLTKDSEFTILRHYNEYQDAKSFNSIVSSHLRFVLFIINKYKIPNGIDVMDIIQEGNMGLMLSIPKFNIEKFSCRIATYSQFWIRFYINKALSSKKKNTDVISYVEDLRTVDTPYDEDPEEYRGAQSNAYGDIAKNLLKTLPPREYKVLSLLLGIEAPYKPLTLREVGTMIHINAERVRGIKNLALDRLKERDDISILFK